MDNTFKRRAFDLVVWSVSLLFAFGLLTDSAMANYDGASGVCATSTIECRDPGLRCAGTPR